MTTFIQTAHELIGDLLSRQINYHVPEHQRDFAWTEDEVTQFWEDIKLGMQQASEHFLGPIVVRQVEEGRAYEVIDGQQRLTTSLILLAAIRNIYHETGDALATTIQATYFGYVDRRTRETHPKFGMNSVNNDTFREFIAEIKPETAFRSAETSRRTKLSNKRILQAYLLLKHKLEELCGPPDARNLVPLADVEDYIKERLSVIQIIVSDEADAYTLFETLNERGIELSVLDLLKNHLFKNAGTSRESIKQKWAETLANLDEAQGTKFIRHYWVSKNGRVQAGALYRAIRDSARTRQAVVQLADDLRHNSALYAALSLPDHEFWDGYDQSMKNDIATLKLLNSQQCLPVLMAAHRHFDKEGFQKIVRLMVVMAVRYSLICAYRTGALEIGYADVAQKISSGALKRPAAVRRALGDIYPSDDEFREAFSSRELRSAKHVRFLLREIELYQSGGTLAPVNDPASVNLEHIAPRTKTNSWQQQLGNLRGESYEWWAYRIGNQSLIEKSINHNVGTEGFADKKKAYAQSAIPSMQQILSEDAWTTDKIETRQAQQAGYAIDIWKYDVDPVPQVQ